MGSRPRFGVALQPYMNLAWALGTLVSNSQPKVAGYLAGSSARNNERLAAVIRQVHRRNPAPPTRRSTRAGFSPRPARVHCTIALVQLHRLLKLAVICPEGTTEREVYGLLATTDLEQSP